MRNWSEYILKADPMRTTWIGFFLNLTLGLGKTGAGVFLSSKALIADGMHSLLDLLSDIAVLIGLTLAQRPEDAGHHYGHHKYASLAKFFIGGLLILFSLGLVAAAIFDLHSGQRAVPQAGMAALVALASILFKELLFWWTRSVARRVKSDLLLANAWHHRTDSISSVGVAVAMLAVWLGGPEWAFLDSAVTMLLGGYLVLESGKIFLRACGDLLDAAPEQAIVEDLREHVLPTPGAIAYHDFRVRRIGDVFEIDLHLQVDPVISVEAGHQIAKAVKDRMLVQHPEISKILIHVEPANQEHMHMRGIADISQKSTGASPERNDCL